MRILFDHDLQDMDIPGAALVLRNFLIDDFAGRTVSPLRHDINLDVDHITLTSGAQAEYFGFRAYTHRAGLKRSSEDQVVACWEKQSHRLLGLAVGQSLGVWRTGLLGGIARAGMVMMQDKVCGVLGAGVQAMAQARVTARLNPPKCFLVYAPTEMNREQFAKELFAKAGVSVRIVSAAEPLVRQSDVLIVATNALTPVFEVGWLENCLHITTVGPKLKSGHEAPVDLAGWADLIASDSPQQIAAHGSRHFLVDRMGDKKVHHLGAVIAQTRWLSASRRTLYLSAGLAGTEVALLAHLLDAPSI